MKNNRQKFKINKNGFTLAEVLITLVIIGIIAAMTIPTTIANYQKQQTVDRLKKVYSTLQQAINRGIYDYGAIDLTNVSAGNGALLHDNYFTKYLKPYLSITDDCGTSSTGVCASSYSFRDNRSYKLAVCGSSYSKFYLNDGTSVAIIMYNSPTLSFFVDINGQKGPNIYGRDLFRFDFNAQDNSFKPPGIYQNRLGMLAPGTYNCNKTQGTGDFCTTVIMLDGWQIKDDYPW